MTITRTKLKYVARKCLTLLVFATLFCDPAFCGEIHDAAKNGDLESEGVSPRKMTFGV
jgi:hypothetical protein